MTTAESIFSSVGIEEPHIIIGTDRFITVPTSLRRIAVEHDHNVETVTFECPRYWDEHDLSTMAIYINYVLSNGYADSYPADNVAVEDDVMFFTWTIKREVTQVSGSIKFIVCAKNTDDQGNESNHWNSELCEDMYVSKGLETTPQIASEYQDLITELLLSIKNTSNHIKNSYANAIKGTASGNAIRIDDVSPIEHTINTRVHGKNFIDMTKIPTQDNTSVNYISAVGEGFIEITCTDAYEGDGRVNTTIKLKDLCPQMVAGKQYIFSATSDSFNKGIHLAQIDLFWQFNESITVTEEMLDCYVSLYGYSPYNGQDRGVCRTYDIQIEEGSIITDYEPYVDPTSITVLSLGKNLLPINEITVTKPNAWGLHQLSQVRLAPGTYTARCKFKQTGVDKSTVSLSIRDYDTWTDTISTVSSKEISGELKTTFDVTSERNGVHIYLYSNSSATDLNTQCVFTEIQLEAGSEATTFERYVEFESYTPAIDGTVSIMSIYPTMTIYSINKNIVIEGEYNRDTTKMFESYVLTDEAKNEIAMMVTDTVKNEVVATVISEIRGDLDSVSTLIGGA